MLKESWFDLETDNLRDDFMAELLSRGKSKSQLHRRSLQWKDAPRDKSDSFCVEIGKESLMRAFRARLCAKRNGREIEDFRRDVYNGYVIGSRDHPFDMIEVFRQMEHCHPIQITKEAKRQSRTTARTRITNNLMNDRTK